jgi:hypothetical protein
MYIENNEAFASVKPIPHVEAMHIWRSKFLDKASKCETEIRRIAATPNEKKMPFKALAEKILADRSKTETAKKNEPILKLLEELNTNGFLFLRNAQSSHKHFEKIVSLTAEHRKIAYDRLSAIAGQIAKLS